MLGRLLRLSPPRFSNAPSEDAYVLLIICEYRLFNLGFIETRSVDYAIFSCIWLLDIVG